MIALDGSVLHRPPSCWIASGASLTCSREGTPGGGASGSCELQVSSSKFATFARATGLYDLLPGSEVMLAFSRVCRRQPDSKAASAMPYQFLESTQRTRTGHVPTTSGEFRPREQVQNRMRFPAFAQALGELADIAFAGLHGPFPFGVSARAARLEALVEYIASYTPPRVTKKAKPSSRGAQLALAVGTRLQKLDQPLGGSLELINILQPPSAPQTAERVQTTGRPQTAEGPRMQIVSDLLTEVVQQKPPTIPKPVTRPRPMTAHSSRDYAPGLRTRLARPKQYRPPVLRKQFIPSRPPWVHTKPLLFNSDLF